MGCACEPRLGPRLGPSPLPSPEELERGAAKIVSAICENIDTDAKLSNPKDAIGDTKVPMGLVPGIVIAYASLAWLEGKTKYGGVNWRDSGVRATIYGSALLRHFFKYFDGGEWADKKTRVPHLASIIACAGILLDAELAGKLIDDRPLPQEGLSAAIDELTDIVMHLKELNKNRNPHHYTIQDIQKDKE